MEKVRELSLFYAAIREDHRIGPTHISLYMAIFQLYNLNGFQNPLRTNRAILMGMAKIAGLATFHKCIKELRELGYIQYLPSHDSKVSSQLFILEL
jgi:replication initiation and membrane attachment protein DnaB